MAVHNAKSRDFCDTKVLCGLFTGDARSFLRPFEVVGNLLISCFLIHHPNDYILRNPMPKELRGHHHKNDCRINTFYLAITNQLVSFRKSFCTFMIKAVQLGNDILSSVYAGAARFSQVLP